MINEEAKNFRVSRGVGRGGGAEIIYNIFMHEILNYKNNLN